MVGRSVSGKCIDAISRSVPELGLGKSAVILTIRMLALAVRVEDVSLGVITPEELVDFKVGAFRSIANTMK